MVMHAVATKRGRPDDLAKRGSILRGVRSSRTRSEGGVDQLEEDCRGGRPDAIVMVSAHFETNGVAVVTDPAPPMIYDFGGFEPELYRMQYPAPGDPALAKRVIGLLGDAGFAPQAVSARGYDHGAWTPLMAAFPEADIPVVQVSIDPNRDARYHYALGQALASLRAALSDWSAVRAPYDVARCRVLIARACRQLGDTETADLEAQAARVAFADLGAAPELSLLDAESPGRRPAPAGLTPRELEVLRMLATGRSNRDIARELVLSERTVARHVANIFAKTRVGSRAAATAFAYDSHLM